MNIDLRSSTRTLLRRGIATGLGLLLGGALIASATTLSDQPVFSTSNVPGNLALTLSVEWPTASRTAHVDAYTSASTYLGYFDPNKCYLYQIDTTANSTATGDSSHFYPAGLATNRACTGANDAKWSGNFLNWASTATIDPFRWAMTGGRRVVDDVDTTILEKAWHSGQGGLFNDRDLTVGEIASATPFNSATRVGVSINGRGFKMRLSTTGGGSRSMTAQYYNNITLTNPVIATVTTDNANHDWGTGSPVAGVNADNFSARFTGNYTAPETGSYVFRTRSDDGIRLWVDTTGLGIFNDATRRINNWTDHGPTNDDTIAIPLVAGQTFSVRVEFYERGGGAVMQLLWQKPSSSAFTAFTDDSGDTDYTMRVKVCDPSVAAGGPESNCKAYGSNYKPEGLIQQYSQKIRFSAFGYLNDDNYNRDGAVLRAKQKFVGPTYPVPGQAPATNAATEWSTTTGQFVRNPDAIDSTNTQTATGVTVADSGVMNYLNQFGQLIPGSYKSYDPVNELYYAALRYYRNLGNVSTWSDTGGTADANTKRKWVDGFPVITNWADPMQYACQRNFVLGIGDIYTHGDKNVPGNTLTAGEPTVPTAVSGDVAVSAITSTNKVKSLQGMGENLATSTTGSSNSTDYMAGLAYDASTKDIRSDLTGKQTVQTYWVDVLEAPFVANNKFYLAAKFGGLNQKKLPAGFDPYTFAGTIPLDWWSTNGELLPGNVPRPDNYFAAGRPDTMVAGLRQAFERISNEIEALTTSFSLSSLQTQSLGTASYAARYDAKDWSGEVIANEIAFAADGTPSETQRWSSTTTLATQLAGTGWDINRRVATWSGTAGVPFRAGSLTTAQATALDTSYVTGNDSGSYLNYLRGDRSQEKTDTDNTKPYRKRGKLLGDVVNAKVKPVGVPAMRYSDSVNPGYAAFKTAKSTRPTMVYVGANDGMLHAFNGAMTGTSAGVEQFAYVPGGVYQGPSTPATPQVDGLAQLGSPNYLHHYYVDSTPEVFDLDLNSASGTFTTTTAANSRWRSLLIGGLGKGGKSYYAIDVTDPGTMTDESTVASKVKWEFTDATMGFSFGSPIIIKTKRYGWVAVLTSGYNNSDGFGYLYFVNPETGALLQKVSTPTAANGLTHASAYIQDFTDGTADAIYVGDLDGQLWRFDVTAPRGTTTDYPAPTKLATLTDGGSPAKAQPITTRPLIEIQPTSRKRFVMFGTGQLLDSSDISSPAAQSFYAVLDGTGTAFRPADATMPVTRAQLTALTDLTTGVTLPNTSLGWYLDFGVSGGIGMRLVTEPTSFNGLVAFSSLLTSGDACTPTGSSRLYVVDFATGKSALAAAGVTYLQFSSSIIDNRFIGVDGKGRLLVGFSDRGPLSPPLTGLTGTAVRLLNWREVPTVD